MPSGNICPIFPVSSVTKMGFEQLTEFIWRIENAKEVKLEEIVTQPFEF
jgi:GTPase